jgi:hypothetical protein
VDVGKLLKWALVLGLVFLAWTLGRPWVEEHLSRRGRGAAVETAGSGDDPEAGTYAEVAAGFAAGDPGAAWMRDSALVEDAVGRGEGACGCPGDACRLAGEALSELDSLVRRTDALVRDGGDRMVEPARDIARVHDLLDEAQRAR